MANTVLCVDVTAWLASTSWRPGVARLAPSSGAAADRATRREGDDARLVREPGIGHDGWGFVHGYVFGGDDAGAPLAAITLDHLGELGEHGLALAVLGTEHVLEVGDRAPQFVALLFELELFELRQPPQLHVEDGHRLDLAQLELGHQSGAGLVAVFGTANDLDDCVDGIERFEQTFDDVDAITGFAQSGTACA